MTTSNGVRSMYFAVTTVKKSDYLEKFNQWKDLRNKGINPVFDYNDISIYVDDECGEGMCSNFNIDPFGEYDADTISLFIDVLCERDYGLTIDEMLYDHDRVKIFLDSEDINNVLSALCEDAGVCHFDEFCDGQLEGFDLEEEEIKNFPLISRAISCLQCLKRYQESGNSVYVCLE